MALSSSKRASLVQQAINGYLRDHRSDHTIEEIEALMERAEKERVTAASDPEPPPPPDTPPNPDTPPPNDGGGSGGNSGSGGGGGD